MGNVWENKKKSLPIAFVLVGACLLFFQNCTGDFKASTASAVGADASLSSTGTAPSPSCINVESYALQSALKALPASGGCLQFSAGKFLISSQLSDSMANAVDSINISGAGQDLTILYWPNKNGGLQFTYNNLGNSVHISDLSLTTGQAAGGTALSFLQNYSAPGLSSGYNAVSNLSAVTIRGDDGYSAMSDYWTVGLNIYGVSNINMSSSLFQGAGGSAYSTVGTGIITSGDSQDPSKGIYACVLNISNTDFNLLNIGIEYGTFAQGVALSQTNFTGDSFGIAAPANESGLGQLAVNNSQFNVAVAGIWTSSPIDGLTVTSSLFLIPVNGVGVWLDHSAGTEISGNEFAGIGANTNGLVINNSAAASAVFGNTFELLTTGIWLQAQSSAVTIQSSGYTSDANSVVNQGSGNTF